MTNVKPEAKVEDRNLGMMISKNDDAHTTIQFVRNHPEELGNFRKLLAETRRTILDFALRFKNYPIARYLIELGEDVNEPSEKTFPLEQAIHDDQLTMAKFLIDHGADPNLGRTLFAAIRNEGGKGLEMMKLLVAHGVDVNQVFQIFDDPNNLKTALDWAGGETTEFGKYLRSVGAKTADEITAEKRQGTTAQAKSGTAKPTKATPSAAPTLPVHHREIAKFFVTQFGRIQRNSINEIVHGDPSITIYVIPPNEKANCVTLFTAGMSAQPMNTPPHANVFRFAELFLQLPADWPMTSAALTQPDHGWPIEWLRNLARFPFHNNTWIGGVSATFGNESAKDVLAPNNRFTGMFAFAEHRFQRQSDGANVMLYRLIPLFWEEIQLERKQGVPALMRAFDKHQIGFVIDSQRINVGKQK
jgi:hypothetical protein